MGIAAIYFQGFEANNADSWVARDSDTTVTVTTTLKRTGSYGLSTVWSDIDDSGSLGGAKRTITGLTIGVDYTFSAYGATENPAFQKGCYIGVTGKSQTTTTYPAANTWTLHSLTFTATATSHEFYLGATGSYGYSPYCWDDITVTYQTADTGNMLMMFS